MKKNSGNIVQIIGNIALVGDNFIHPYNLNGAKNGDIVEIEKIGSNPNIPEYKVVNIIKSNLQEIIEKSSQKIEDLLVGTYRKFDENGGFIKIEGQKDEIFVKKNNSLNAGEGDKVSLSVLKLGNKFEAIIHEILEKQKKYKFAIFEDGKILLEGKKEIKISNLNSFELKDGDVFSVEQLEGQTFAINQKLNEKWNNSFEELKIVLNEGVEVEFSDEVLEEVNKIPEKIEESEILRRVDLRNLYTITTDGRDTKDIDDAISVEDLGNGESKLYVHIADVSHYIKPGMKTWEEAKKRGTSIYFVDKVIPMIPEKLSNGLCSLNPNEDKLSMTCEMIIAKNGKIDFSKSKVYESVIRSDARTTYKEVQDIFSGKKGVGENLQFSENIDENLIETVKNAFSLSRKLNNLRKSEGELNFGNREIKISLDEKRKTKGFKKYDFFESNDLIKALMVAANETVANLYGNGPFLHRTHEKPKEEKIELLKNILNYLEINLDGIEINIGNIQEILEKIKGHPKEKALNVLILKTLQVAKITDTLEGHHGLALQKGYSWFTSPIRRFPDSQIHLIIKETNNKSIKKEEYDDLLKTAEKCTLLEQRAEKIEKNINTLYSIIYLEDKIGKNFDATIMNINERGTVIELDLGNINGNIILDKEAGYSYSKIDKGIFEIIPPNGEILKIGDKTRVKLVKVDRDSLNINFELI